VRGNKPLLSKGLCSQSQINAQEYLFIVEDLKDHIDFPNKPKKEETELIIGALDIDDEIRALMNNLEHKEMEIVILYFGLYKDKPMSLEKVAKRLGKSREWTRKRLNNALDKMKVIS
jgi:DNA-directed RNA polymerase sigma subunit (sigma70/sigma32)